MLKLSWIISVVHAIVIFVCVNSRRISHENLQVCVYEWQIVASLAGEGDDSFNQPSATEKASRAVGINGASVFDSKALMKLTWVLSKRIGESGEIRVDWRATSQAYGLGIIPDVQVEGFFWDSRLGRKFESVGELFFGKGPTRNPEKAWSTVINITESSSMGPQRIRTKAFQGKYKVCESQHVLRTPLIELLDTDDIHPYVLVGGSASSLGKSIVRRDGAWNRYTKTGFWDRFELNAFRGVSWVWFALAYSAGGGNGLVLWVSSNDFQDIGPISASVIDLVEIFPFQNPREGILFDWDLDPFDEDVYAEMEDDDVYNYNTIDTSFNIEGGPCHHNSRWNPQIFSFGRWFVASTTWGIAYRVAGDVSFDNSAINENWKTIAPLCSRIFPLSEIDPIDRHSGCMFHVVPEYPSMTVNFENETTFNHKDFKNIKLPTLFLVKPRLGGSSCVQERATSSSFSRQRDNDYNAEIQSFFDDNNSNNNSTTTTKSVDHDGEFVVTELIDCNGHALHEAFDLVDPNDTIVSVVTILSNGPFTTLVLVQQRVTSTYTVYTFHSKKWIKGSTFSEAKKLHLEGTVGSSSVVYSWGSFLFFCDDGFGHLFHKVEQLIVEKTVDDISGKDQTNGYYKVDEDHLLFSNDPIITFTTSIDGWVACITNSSNVWIGRKGSTRIFLLERDIATDLNLEKPLKLFFNDVGALFVIGFSHPEESNKFETLESAVQIDFDWIELLATQTVEGCALGGIYLFARHPTETVRILHDHTKQLKLFSNDLRTQEHSFYNELPERIFLDFREEYQFVIRLFASATQENNNKLPMLFRSPDKYQMGFKLSNQTLIKMSTKRLANPPGGYIDYVVTLRDQGNWINPSSGLPNSLPGENLLQTNLQLLGLSQDCSGLIDETGISSMNETHPAIQFSIYSGCPPLKKINFDPVASRGNTDHGCVENGEDICLFYHSPFEPIFQLLDVVTGETKTVGSEFGNILVVGGGLTYDEIEDFPLEEVVTLSSLMITFETPNKLRWVCLVKGSPCYYVTPSFPDPPQYFFKLQFQSNMESSYCDFSTVFIVRVHNLPITIETILLTNFATIFVFLIPMIIVFRNQQRKLAKTLMRVQDVDVSQYSRATRAYDSGSSDDDDSFGDSDDDDDGSDDKKD